jgi:ElaA protein
VQWHCRGFDELDPALLYQIMQLRQQVFVVEQNCVYQDLDGLDQASHHLYGQREGQLMAYLRCVPPGLSYSQSSLGRIVVGPEARGLKLGRELVQRGIDHNRATWPQSDIKIGAQAYLEKFYTDLGFRAVGDSYDEDGIPHLKMILEQK